MYDTQQTPVQPLPLHLQAAWPRKVQHQHRVERNTPFQHQYHPLLRHVPRHPVTAETVTTETDEVGVLKEPEEEHLPQQQVVAHGAAEVRVGHLLHAGDLGLDVRCLTLHGERSLPLPAVTAGVEVIEPGLKAFQPVDKLALGGGLAAHDAMGADLPTGHWAGQPQLQQLVLQNEGHLVRRFRCPPVLRVKQAQHCFRCLYFCVYVLLHCWTGTAARLLLLLVLLLARHLVAKTGVVQGGGITLDMRVAVTVAESEVGKADAQKWHSHHPKNQSFTGTQTMKAPSESHFCPGTDQQVFSGGKHFRSTGTHPVTMSSCVWITWPGGCSQFLHNLACASLLITVGQPVKININKLKYINELANINVKIDQFSSSFFPWVLGPSRSPVWGSWDPLELHCGGPGTLQNCSVGVLGPFRITLWGSWNPSELQCGGPGTL